MNKLIIEKILLFLAGGLAGGFGAGMIINSKWEKKYEAEISEIRKAAKEGYHEGKKAKVRDVRDDDSSDISEEDYAASAEVASTILQRANDAKNKEDVQSILERKGYVNYSRTPEPERNEVPEEEEYVPEEDDIEIIAPEEFGELRDYEQETLYYLRGNILVDDEGHPVEDVGKYVSYEALNEFGAYGEADSVYVRNHNLKMDIGIFQRDETLANFSG